MLHKLIKYAKSLGIDPEELMNMTVFEAMMKVQEIQDMWKELAKDTK